MEQIRSFIAIELPDEVKTQLSRLEANLKSGQPSPVKWVEPDSIHLTLKFLGNITADSINAITGAIREAAQGITPFCLEVKNLGVFPNLKRIQVAWVGVQGEVDKLSQLQQRIESNLVDLGFDPESRPFTSHLTLARVRNRVSSDERQRFGQLIASTEFEGGTFIVNTISLMRSQLGRTAAVYRRISSVSLSGPGDS